MPTRHSKESKTDEAAKETANLLIEIATTVRESTEINTSLLTNPPSQNNNATGQNIDNNNDTGNQNQRNVTEEKDSSDDEENYVDNMETEIVNENDCNSSVSCDQPTSFSKNDFPNKFQYFKDKSYPQVEGSVHNSEDQLSTISFLVYLRGLVYN